MNKIIKLTKTNVYLYSKDKNVTIDFTTIPGSPYKITCAGSVFVADQTPSETLKSDCVVIKYKQA